MSKKEKKPGVIRKFFGEFKKFIMRGNVLDLAVGVIIGGAFTAIVNGLSNNVLKPLINWVLSLAIGKDGLGGAITMLSPAYDEAGALVLADSIYIDWGAFISAIINFLIVALVLFCIIRVFNRVAEAKEQSESNWNRKKEIFKIRFEEKVSRKKAKELYEQRLADKKAKEAEEARLAEEKKAEEARLAEEKAMANTRLLEEIRDLLKQK